MTPEIDRYDWPLLRAMGSAKGVPDALRALETATSADEAQRAYWRIDNTVVVQGALYESAAPAAACLVAMLPRCTGPGRAAALELLVQLGAGEPAPSEQAAGNLALRAQCLDELCKGSPLYIDGLGAIGGAQPRPGDVSCCVDLLGLCAGHDPAIVAPALVAFERLLGAPLKEGLHHLVQAWVDDLRLER